MNIKDYLVWHRIKRHVHNKKERPFFHEREVWFCSLGENVGFEQDGIGERFLRPVIIVKKFNNEVCWVVPLTKTKKTGRYYFRFRLNGSPSTAIISQLRLLDTKRLQYKIGDLAPENLATVKKNLRRLLA